MKRFKKWAVLMTVASPFILGLGCSGSWLQQIRNAAVTGAADYVQGQTFDFLNANADLSGLGGG